MKATIVNTVDNTTKVVELPEAVTDLSGLKHFLSISDGQFFEGTTHTDLTSDRQSIPAIPAEKADKGYVFFVSPAQNKFKNGALTRKECYAYVKEYNLGDLVKETFGRNFTQVSTNDLNNIICNAGRVSDTATAPVDTASTNTCNQEAAAAPTVENLPVPATEKELWKTLLTLINTVDATECKQLYTTLSAGIDKVFPNPYSAQDLANMHR